MLESLICGETQIPAQNLPKVMKQLASIDSKHGKSGYEVQFGVSLSDSDTTLCTHIYHTHKIYNYPTISSLPFILTLPIISLPCSLSSITPLPPSSLSYNQVLEQVSPKPHEVLTLTAQSFPEKNRSMDYLPSELLIT